MFKKRYIYTFLIFFFCFYTVPAYAQLGIFEKTADWGTADFPPQRGALKVPGSVEVTGSGDSAVYLMKGNGDDIWDNNDEGFFVYKELAGSWSLSAKVYWEYNGGSSDWAKVGVMIRENAADPESRHYWIELRSAGMGDQTDAQWRMAASGPSGGSQIYDADGNNITDPGEGLWLRVSRYASIDLVRSEYSLDGNEWHFAHSTTMELPETVAYGLAITNHEDNSDLAEATVSEVKLVEVPPMIYIERGFDSLGFRKGGSVKVTLSINNSGMEASNVVITETPPVGFAISEISDGGTPSGGTITWDYSAPLGDSEITYRVTAPADYDPDASGYSVEWSGSGGLLPSAGPSQLFLFEVAVGETLFSYDFEDASQTDQWEDLAGFFDIENGMFYEFEDAGGPLVTITGDDVMTDVAITVDAMGLVADADWGIAFRAMDINNHYSWQYVNSGLYLIIYSGGARTEILIEDFAEVLNEWQNFQVIVKGNVIYMLLDGEIHSVIVDDTLTEGYVGLFGWVNSGSPVEDNIGGIVFDNFVVSSVTEGVDVSQWSVY